MTNKFRNSSNTRYLQGLFFEQTSADKTTVLYTLKNEDHEGYPSLYRLYMTVADPTEYRFANEWLDGWEHWEGLCNCSWFKGYVSRWRRELELKIKSEALASIINESRSTSSNSYQAAKFLVNGEYTDKARRGRPSKAEVKGEAYKIAEDKSRIIADFNRITQKELH